MPSLFLKAVILALAAGMVAFCAKKALEGDREGNVKIGYAAPKDRLTEMAVSYVEGMESVKSWCKLIAVTEEEGKELLAEGELAALLVLPANVVDGILTGENEPARLYMSEAVPMAAAFEELANAAVGLLQTAQAEIYATHALLEEFSPGLEELEAMYQEINAFNLKLAMNRGDFFHTRALSATGNIGIAVYYGSALLTVFLLLAGLFFGKYIKRSSKEALILKKRLGIPYAIQLSGRILVTTGMLLLLFLLPGVMWLSEDLRGMLQPEITAKSLFLLLLTFPAAAALFQFLYLLADNQRTGVIWVGITALLMGYFSGCFLPAPLLPKVAQEIARFLPSTYIKAAFTLLFSGEDNAFWGILSGLLIAFLLLWAAGWFCMRHMTEGRQSRE